MAFRQYSQQISADAVALYRSRPGATVKQIADDLGVNRETFRTWLREAGQRGRSFRAARLATTDALAR